MKKPIKRILWGFVIVVALLFAMFGWYGIKASSETKKMSPAETGLISDGILTIKDSFVNMYFVKSGTSYIAIDAGNSVEGIAKGLSELKISPESVIAVLLTHTDGDHVNALGLFPKATIYISKQEEKMINGEKSRFLFFGNTLSGRSYKTIDDDQVFDILDLKVHGILVSGHTPVSMCYLINDKYLFTGDALSLKDGKVNGFNEFFNMDTKTALQSMSRITNLEKAKYILTAHHGFNSDYKNAVRDWK